MTQPDPHIGRQLVDGMFRITEKIHSGRTGAIYKAEQPGMNRTVAVKILHSWHRARSDLKSRFRREARALSHLAHPNTTKVLLYGELEDRTLYMILEHIPGKTLAEVIRSEGPLSAQRAIPIVVQLCGALEEAHLQGIIHRDLKPGHILLTTVGNLKDFPKLLDFGVAKVTARELQAGSFMLTTQGAVIGSPEYMSPEAAQGKVLDARSDIYSLTVILYEMLTRKLPFDGRVGSDYLLNHVCRPPIPLQERAPGLLLPPGLEAVVATALEKEPEARYASAMELAEALKPCLAMKAEPRASASIEGAPRVGERIDDKYVVERVLGAGGMGVVVAAWDLTLRRRVAIKLMLPRALRIERAHERFVREARAAAAIQSEHVVKILGVDTSQSGAPYIVMEHLEGVDLSELLSKRGPLPVHEAVAYVLQSCEALAEAHRLGIVHRDLKPSNIFITVRADGSPIVKLLDFGLSKVIADSDEAPAESLTASSLVAGSPHYMSPEQARSLKNVDARTDIWSLGVVLYELLTSTRPFEAESASAILARILTDPPPLMRSVRPELPAELEAIVLRCLQKQAGLRTPNVAELVRGLAPFASDASSAPPGWTEVMPSPGQPVDQARQEPSADASGAQAGSTTAFASTMTQTRAEPGVSTILADGRESLVKSLRHFLNRRGWLRRR